MQPPQMDLLQVCGTLVAFFESLPETWSTNLYRYILNSLLIHFDDANERVQDAVVKALEAGMHHKLDVFLEETKKTAMKSRSIKKIGDLINIAENFMAIEGEA